MRAFGLAEDIDFPILPILDMAYCNLIFPCYMLRMKPPDRILQIRSTQLHNSAFPCEGI